MEVAMDQMLQQAENNNIIYKIPKRHKSKMSPDLIDTPIYNEDMMNYILDGILSNICIEMDKQNISVRELGDLSGVDYSHLSRVFNGHGRIGLTAMIKIAYALHISPRELFPYDEADKRKTNGDRFNELTKEMDLSSSNFLLSLCVNCVKEWRRLKATGFDKERG